MSLGHAAFFGFGAYAAGLLAKYGIVKEPVLALVVSGFAAAVVGLVSSFLVLRGSDLTRLMVTLGVALVLREIANQVEFTGGADGLQGIVMAPCSSASNSTCSPVATLLPVRVSSSRRRAPLVHSRRSVAASISVHSLRASAIAFRSLRCSRSTPSRRYAASPARC